MKTITLRLDDDDHKLFAVLATAEDMPLTTLIRRTLKQLARERGLLAPICPPPAHAPKPAPVPTTGKTPEERLAIESAEFLRHNPAPPDDGLDYYIGRGLDGALHWVPRAPEPDDSYPDE
jgi:hypothetical protein